MLLLTFRIGSDRYAIDAENIVELIPLVILKEVPQAPRGVAGLLDYHGAVIPAVDLSEIATGRPARRVMSTRIAVVRYSEVLLGVIVEDAVKTMRRDEAAFTHAGVEMPEAPYLGGVMRSNDGVIQEIDVRQLISDEVRQRLLT